MNVKSGGCTEDCAFCAQSAHNKAPVDVKPLASVEEIAAQHRVATSNDVEFCMVSSGRRLSPADVDQIVESAKRCGAPVHASLGILSDADFVKLKDAGVVCYNHNIETSRRYFAEIVKSHDYDDRIATVKKAKAAGLGVCCGGIFGMGEAWQDRIDMAFELRDLGVDVVPVNFLNAVPGTRVEKPKEPPREYLKIIALFRFILPDRIIKVCGGREVNLRSLQPLMFLAGANGYVAGNYLTTSGQSVAEDNAMIADLGLVAGHEHEFITRHQHAGTR
jgi:biotin synthase